MQARLVLTENGLRANVFDLDAPDLVIGRDPDVDIVIHASRVSRRHAVVRQLGEHHTVADLGSSNGTTVNGARVTEAVVLRPGDVIVEIVDSTINDLDDFRAAAERYRDRDKNIAILIRRGDLTSYVTVDPRDRE